MSEALQRVLVALQELEQDTTVPKNVKTKIANTIGMLQTETEVSIKVSRALHELEGLADDSNMQSYTRSQIFNIVSLLEVV